MPFSQSSILDMFRVAQKQDRIAHAYLITSPQITSLEEFSSQFLSRFYSQGGKKMEIDDFEKNEWIHFLRPVSKSRIIKVEQIRSLEKSLYLKSPKEITKIAFIFSADRLTSEASNAFLKTLEEPPNQVLLFLLTSSPDLLLETIRSRCLQIDIKEDNSFFQTVYMDTFFSELSEIVEAKKFSPLVALSLKECFWNKLNEIRLDLEKKYEGEFSEESKRMKKIAEPRWLSERKEEKQQEGTAEYLRIRDNCLDEIIAWFGDCLRIQLDNSRKDFPNQASATEKFSAQFSLKEILFRLSSIQELKKIWQTNVQEELALEVSFLKAFS